MADAESLATITAPEEPGSIYEPLRKPLRDYGKLEIELLHKALADPEWMGEWQKIAEAIARTDNTFQGAQAIVHYIKRPDDWSKMRPSQQDAIIFRKLNAIAALGLMRDTPLAIETIKKALRPEGVLELTEAWIHEELPGYWKDNIQGIITYGRHRAARGVVYANDPEGIAYIRAEYEALHEIMIRDIGHLPHPAMTEQQRDTHQLYNGLVTALSIHDIIQERGLENYLSLRDSSDYISVYMRYSERYSYRRQHEKQKQ